VYQVRGSEKPFHEAVKAVGPPCGLSWPLRDKEPRLQAGAEHSKSNQNFKMTCINTGRRI
jgi:hypothetical protein